MRTIPAELVKRYEARGVVDPGHHWATCWPAGWRPRPGRYVPGALGRAALGRDLRRCRARRAPAGRRPARARRRSRRRGRLPAAELDGGRRASSGPRRSSARWSCRSSTSTGARRWPTSWTRSRRASSSPRSGSAAWSSSPTCAPGCPSSAWWDSNFDDLLAAEPLPGVIAADPAGPALIAFTSGTTRDPKGVIHSHQTLGFEVRQLAERYPPDRGRQLTAAPVGHFIGMLNAFLIPLLDGSPVNLADVWDPARRPGPDGQRRAHGGRRRPVLS